MRKYASSTALLEPVVETRELTRLEKAAHRHTFEYEPREGYLYVRSRAISSRTNDNFDTFPAEELKKAWASFIGKPVFVNHHNEDINRKRGVIIDAAIHEDKGPDGTEDTWVEVLMEVDASRFPKLAAEVVAKNVERTSMGCDVIESECSFCANVARTPNQYCAHVQRMKGQRLRRKNEKTGQVEEVLVHEICRGLSFFENSLLVEEPADPTAYTYGVDTRGIEMSPLTASIVEQIEKEADVVAQQRKTSNFDLKCGDCGTVRDDYYFGKRPWTCPDCGSDNVKAREDGWHPTPEVRGAPSIKPTASDDGRVPYNVDTLRPKECPVCGEDSAWNSDGRCSTCGYLPAPKPFQEPDTDVAGRVDDGGGWFDPNLTEAPPFEAPDDRSTEINPVQSSISGTKGQEKVAQSPQGDHIMASTNSNSVAMAARRRHASKRQPSEAALVQENEELRERLAAATKTSDKENPAQPVPEPSTTAPAESEQEAVNEPEAQNVDVTTPGAPLSDPIQNGPADVEAVGGIVQDEIVAGTNQTDNVEAPVAGTTEPDPAAVIGVQPDHRGETLGENAFEGDFLQPGADTVPDIGGNAAGAPEKEAARRAQSQRVAIGKQVAAARDRIWASIQLAEQRIAARQEQGSLLDVAKRIEASDDTIDLMTREAAMIRRVVASAPAPKAPAQPTRTASRRAPSLRSERPAVQASTGMGMHTDDESLFE